MAPCMRPPRGPGSIRMRALASSRCGGRLTLVIEGDETDLEEGELIRVAAQLRRQLVNRGPGRVVLLELGGHGDHDGRDGEAFASWQDQVGVPPQELPLPPDLDSADLRT
jgi:hypothetical protein